MGLLDLFEDVKENMEKSRQAKEYIQDARRIIRDTNKSYKDLFDRVMSYAAETEYRLAKHDLYKKDIAKELGTDIDKTLKKFSEFNIDTKMISPSSITNLEQKFHSITSKTIISNPVDIPSIKDIFISEKDYYEARSQYEEARSYKAAMEREKTRLRNHKDHMSEIRSFISSEKGELSSLMDKLKNLIEQLDSGMKKSALDLDEAEYLKGIHKIAEMIFNLISTEFLEDNFLISQKYQMVFNGIKNINQKLPYSPSITDPTIVSAIKKILNGEIIKY